MLKAYSGPLAVGQILCARMSQRVVLITGLSGSLVQVRSYGQFYQGNFTPSRRIRTWAIPAHLVGPRPPSGWLAPAPRYFQVRVIPVL